MKKLLLVTSILMLSGLSSGQAQGKFSGYMFGDYYYNLMRDNGTLSNSASGSAAPGITAMQAFQFRRIYFAYDNNISDQFSSRFRIEVDQAANASNGKIGSFVKDAYLKWKNVFSGSDLIFGMQPTPAFDVSEGAWGYRSLEKTIMDVRGIVDSRDMGLSLKGKVVEDGMVNYWIMVGNGAGTSKPEDNKYKRYYGHIQLKPSANFQATLYADYKDIAKNAAGENGTLTTALFAGYSVPFLYSLGVETYLTSQSNAYTPSGGSIGSKSGFGVSVFGSYSIIPELIAVGRYDYFDPNTDGSSKGDSRNYIIAGLSWKVDKNVSVMPNLLFETYETPAGRGTPDPSITARLTLYYSFL